MTLSDEQIQDLLRVGNPTDEERRLIRLGWAAAIAEIRAQPSGVGCNARSNTEAGWRVMDAQEQRRLLELAAKAVGFIDDATDESGATGLHRGSDGVFYLTSSYGRRDWSPTEDDGDALRLAVSLNLSVKHGVDIWDDTQKMSAYAYFGDFGECFFEEHGSDPYAATRLAIVRAAAAIGEKMEAKPCP